MNKMQQRLASLPKVDEILNDPRLFVYFKEIPRKLILEAIREIIDEERKKILAGALLDDSGDEIFFQQIEARILQKSKVSLIGVINATGVVLHTNLGRACLSDAACANVLKVAAGYSNLEYDVPNGNRGSRHSHVEKIITEITGAEAAMVVNNNAAATMLCLSAMADGKEVIVSRGELVEIGGSFRIPDIMGRSGAKLVEVGTTNKTKLQDYSNSITEETAALMKVHTSNYRIVGFTAEVELDELTSLGKEKGLPVIYDMGSGLIADLSPYGINEPTVKAGIETGIDVILFSGDKLLGGPQAGIIAGKKVWIEKMKKHPLARVLRIDKMTLAALEMTFRAYQDQEKMWQEIPTLRMLTENKETMMKKGEKLLSLLEKDSFYQGELVPVQEQVGGGSAPTVLLQGIGVKLSCPMTAEKLERKLRQGKTPIVGRIIKGNVYLDMRTVSEDELEVIAEVLAGIAKSAEGKI